jgi:fermentation-respiration switch protein FrsA (DUF1100 family)
MHIDRASRGSVWLRGGLAAGALLYCLYVAVLAMGQHRLIYPGAIRGSSAPAAPMEFSAITLSTADGGMTAWWHPSAPGRPVIVFFDGNGGQLRDAADNLRVFAQMGYGLLLVSYPGYAGNPGRPTEASLYATGRAALSWLDAKGERMLVLIGYSLGSGVATQMATEHPIRALVLVAPFISMTRMANLYAPLAPAELVLQDRYDNAAKIGAVRAPVLILHGDADGRIPLADGRRLFELAREPKTFVSLPGVPHEINIGGLAPEITAFLAGI